MERMDLLTTEGLCLDRPVIRLTIGQAVDVSSLHRLRWAIAARDESAREPVEEAQTFAPGPSSDTVRASDGNVLALPQGWVLLPPGDPALTRRVKAAGDHWIIWEKKGRRILSKGVYAAAATIDRIRAELEAQRARRSRWVQTDFVSVHLPAFATASPRASAKAPPTPSATEGT
jgi:hypothetical protein